MITDRLPPKASRAKRGRAALFAAVAITAATGLLLGQGFVTSSHHTQYDPKSQPPMSLSEAHELAMAHVGAATNRLWCVTATCLDETKHSSFITHWTFGFSNTNAELTKVVVFFDQTVGQMVGADFVRNPLK